MLFKEKIISNIDYIVVGLGNPGKKYENTRHNAGFMIIDELAEKYFIKVNKLKFKGLIGECTIKNKRILLLKPDTFMNLSGESVVQVMNFYKVKPTNVILAFDDISLPVGKLRVRRKGSHGGQNGVKNIIYLSGSDEFPRIKIGIGAKPHPDYDLTNWVLSKFSDNDLKLLNETKENACIAIENIIDGDIDKAMSLFN
ncbi:MAG: aminoacyl-tRNA hydrolase [Clostridia bacterium]